jgi:hypothetical protein
VCGHIPRTATHGPTPSELPRETDLNRRATLERELAAERTNFATDVAALRATLARVEQLLREVKVRATRAGELSAPLHGQAPESERDRLLGPLRSEIAAAAARLDQVAWS